jgi:hypothetical protein
MLMALAFLILIEQGSPGLVPSMKFSYVTSYDANLAFHESLFTYPLLQTPGAIIATGDDLIVAEGLQLVRHDHLGVATKLGLPLNGYPVAMAFGERGDLFVAFTGEIERLTPSTGTPIRHVYLAPTDSPVDFDLDFGGCLAYVALFPRLARIDLCAAEPHLETIASDGYFSAVRVLPNGNLLVASFGFIELRGRDGAFLMRYPKEITASKIALDPTGTTAITTSSNSVSRVHLAGVAVVAGPVRLERGIYVRSMAVVNEWRAGAPRRRRASHP